MEAERAAKANTPRVPRFSGWGVGPTLSHCRKLQSPLGDTFCALPLWEDGFMR